MGPIYSQEYIIAGYYDFVLGLIPLAFLGVTGALVLGGIGLMTAVPLGALVSLGLVIHDMFVDGPADAPAVDGATRDRPFKSAD
jgi:hypothetical protein